MKIKERLAILLAIAILLSACSGTGTNADNDKPSDTDKDKDPTPMDVPVTLMGGAPAHPFFYLLKYSVDQTKLPDTGQDTEFSFLLMQTESNNPFTADTKDQVIRRKAGDGDNIAAMMIQAGDAAERIYDASGTGTIDTTDPKKHVYSMPRLSNRLASEPEPTNLKYSKPLRLLIPDTDYHLYVRVNNTTPIKLASIKTAASGDVDELSYDVDAATAGSTLTFSTRNEEPFYPSARRLLWNGANVPFTGIEMFSATDPYKRVFKTERIPSSTHPQISALEVTDANFVNLRYVDAALTVAGRTKTASNGDVYWFDTDAAHKDWPTIRFKQELIVDKVFFATHTTQGSLSQSFFTSEGLN